MIKNTYHGIDFMKFICAFLVIAVHTDIFSDINPDLRFVVVHILARIAVPFFSVCAGYFFTAKMARVENPSRYAKTYLKRLLLLYLGWSLVYFAYDFIYILNYIDPPVVFYSANSFIDAILKYLVLFVFFGSHYHLWFIPALILAIALLYLAIRFNKIALFAVLSGLCYLFGLSGNSYYGLVGQIKGLRPIYETYFQVMFTTRNGLFFAFGFVMMGALLYYLPAKLNSRTYLIGYLVATAMLIGEVLTLRTFGLLYDVDMYVMMIPAAWFVFRYLASYNPEKRLLERFDFRRYSIGIYFIHGLFIILYHQILELAGLENAGTLVFLLVSLSSMGVIWLTQRFQIPYLVKLVQ